MAAPTSWAGITLILIKNKAIGVDYSQQWDFCQGAREL